MYIASNHDNGHGAANQKGGGCGIQISVFNHLNLSPRFLGDFFSGFSKTAIPLCTRRQTRCFVE